MTIIIPGELTDLNTYIAAERTNRFLASKIKREQTELVAWNAAGTPPVTDYPIHIEYVWYSKDKRKDIDNVAFAKKFINDGLVLAGVLKGDSRKCVAGFTETFFIDKKRPRVEVTIFHAGFGPGLEDRQVG